MTRKLLLVLCGLLLTIGCDSESDRNDTQSKENMTEISVTMLHQIVASNQDLFLLDVRTKPEFDDAHLSFTDFQISHDLLPSALDQLPTDKATKIYCFCRSGRRSDVAATFLRKQGYVTVLNVTGGIIAWRDAGYDIVGDPNLIK